MKNSCKITLDDKKFQILLFQIESYIISELKMVKLLKKWFHAKI